MLALPCCRRGGSVDRDGDAARGASATGSQKGEAPSAAPPAACGGGGGGGRARSMSATVLVALGWGRRRARGGDRRRGDARLLRAAEMRLKTCGSDAGGRSAGGGSCRIVGTSEAPAPAEGEGGPAPVLCPPLLAGTSGTLLPPHPAAPPRPPRGRREPGGSVSCCCAPPPPPGWLG